MNHVEPIHPSIPVVLALISSIRLAHCSSRQFLMDHGNFDAFALSGTSCCIDSSDDLMDCAHRAGDQNSGNSQFLSILTVNHSGS